MVTGPAGPSGMDDGGAPSLSSLTSGVEETFTTWGWFWPDSLAASWEVVSAYTDSCSMLEDNGKRSYMHGTTT